MKRRRSRNFWRAELRAVLLLGLLAGPAVAAPESHPPLRVAQKPVERPLVKGPAYYADAGRGDDRNDGSREKPWKTINHALRRLKADDTLYLRGGVYAENVTVALAGRADAPLTISSIPGESAILDGSLSEFREAPADAWEPWSKGGEGEFRSQKSYPNLRDVVGSFGDSMIGLQTYYHAQDLRATGELVDWEDWSRQAETDLKPLYLGPGLWYDTATGHIHVRLAHTHLPEPVPNYRGETDPRKLPLLIAPFRSLPLHVDGARHVRFQDLVIRGAGYAAVVLEQAHDVHFDNVTIWCGTYGVRATGVEGLRLWSCGLYGSVAPWTFRADASKRDYPGRPHRNLSRLNTHAVLDVDAGRESSVYYTPQNDRWEIGHCEFTDAHDGLYLGAINVHFHHNLIENLQDDGLYLSPMYPRHRLEKKDPEIHVHENVFRGVLTALAFGGSEPETRDTLFVYRNVFDLRARVATGRPSVKARQPSYNTGKLIGDHGSPPWPVLNFYHNTIAASASRQADMAALAGTRAGHPRRVFNNVFFHLDRLPSFAALDATADVVEDGNLYWAADTSRETAAAFFRRFRASPAFEASKMRHAPGSTTSSLVADPLFRKAGDYRLGERSPATDAGVELPQGWPDPRRKFDRGKPDLGAIPSGAESPPVGRTVDSKGTH